MTRFLPTLWMFVRKNRLVVSVLVIATCALIWFGANMISNFLYFNDPRHQDLALKGWMTPKYIVLSYDLPRQNVADILGITSKDQRGTPMRDIAEGMGVTLDELTEIVRAAAAEYRSNGS
jgi:hypothetical protein